MVNDDEDKSNVPPPLLERILKWSKETPEKVALTFVDDKGTPSASLTYKELVNEAQKLAKYLLSQDINKGDCVLLVYPPGLDFVVSFLACLYAGIIAVPVFPPDPRKLKKDIVMFTAVASDCKAKFALTNKFYQYAKKAVDIKQKLSLSKNSSCTWPELTWLVTDNYKMVRVQNELPLSSLTDDIAFLQYTSGSTSNPKGVMISFGNLAHNLTAISKGLASSTSTVVVSWLPQYHDMGLIGAYLGLLYNGGSGFYMSPLSFIKSPSLWIELISRHKATHVQAPNFAYALCARKLQSLDPSTTDLSAVQHMINAAEPVDKESVDAFYEALTPFGLKPGVIVPTYGLAEHTVYVCDGGSQRICVNKEVLEKDGVVTEALADGDAKNLVGCGFPNKTPGLCCKIVNPETLEVVNDDCVGEIWLDSPSKALGYYGMERETQELFFATVSGDEEKSERKFLRTGDLGFIHQDELFICGRLKDLIIVRGRNHFPQDIEKTVESIEGIRPGCTAAFSILLSNSTDNNTSQERLAVMAEVRDGITTNASALGDSIRQAVATEHGVSLSGLVLLPSHSICKTTSGKIARQRCKAAYLDSSLKELLRYCNDDKDHQVSSESVEEVVNDESSQVLDAAKSPEQVLKDLHREVATLMRVDVSSVPQSAALQQMGMDSLELAQLRGFINNTYGIEVDETIMYSEHTTLKHLQRAICTGEGVVVASGGDTEAAAVQDNNEVGNFERMSPRESNSSRRRRSSRSTSVCCGCFKK